MPTFQIISDIHLEFGQFSVANLVNKHNIDKKTTLILAGDIGYPSQKIFIDFIMSCSKFFKHIFMVFGNHEYYKTSILSNNEMKDMLNSLNIDNFTILDNDMVEYNGFNIIGSTLWSKVENTEKHSEMNDYRLIKDFTIEKGNELFEKNYEFLKNSISQSEKEGKECIVITHHLPSFKMIHSDYKDSPLSEFFATDCEDLIKHPVKLWVCGHTHKKMECVINNVPVVCNPKGYPYEWSGYTKHCFYEL